MTGDVYRCKRLDFGWSLSPGIFCAFTAQVNAIVSLRLASEIDAQALSRYYVDDCIVRVPRGGAQTSWVEPQTRQNFVRSENERRATVILEDVSRGANFPTSPDKLRWGEAVIYLGLCIDSASRTARVMPSRLFKALTMMHVTFSAEPSATTQPISLCRSLVKWRATCSGSRKTFGSAAFTLLRCGSPLCFFVDPARRLWPLAPACGQPATGGLALLPPIACFRTVLSRHSTSQH